MKRYSYKNESLELVYVCSFHKISILHTYLQSHYFKALLDFHISFQCKFTLCGAVTFLELVKVMGINNQCKDYCFETEQCKLLETLHLEKEEHNGDQSTTRWRNPSFINNKKSGPPVTRTIPLSIYCYTRIWGDCLQLSFPTLTYINPYHMHQALFSNKIDPNTIFNKSNQPRKSTVVINYHYHQTINSEVLSN